MRLPTMQSCTPRSGEQTVGTNCNTHGINFSELVALALPFVPMVRKRVDELMVQAQPGLLKYPLTIRGTWSEGTLLPKGDCLHVSPCEWVHAVIFKCAEAILSKNVECIAAWKKTLLSTPAIFIRIDQEDKIYAEANSLRQEASGFRRAVELSARQLIHNIYGLKERLEKTYNVNEGQKDKKQKELGAQVLLDFWKKEVRISAGNDMMYKEATFDTCITLYRHFAVAHSHKHTHAVIYM